MFGFEPWHLWTIVAVVLFALEIFAPGFVLASMGVGALFAAAIHQYTGDLNWAVGGWILGAALSFVFMRPLLVKTMDADKPSGFGASGMVGDVVTVSDSGDVGGRLRANYRGSTWVLESEDDLMEGDRAVITDVRGTILVVTKENES